MLLVVLDGVQEGQGLFDARGRLVASWVFVRGWPSRWEVTSLQSYQVDAGTEIVEIVHEGLSLEG